MGYYYITTIVVLLILYALILGWDKKINYKAFDVKKIHLKGILTVLFPHKKKYRNEIAAISFFSQLVVYTFLLLTILSAIVSSFIPEDISFTMFNILSRVVIAVFFIEAAIYSRFFDKRHSVNPYYHEIEGYKGDDYFDSNDLENLSNNNDNKSE